MDAATFPETSCQGIHMHYLKAQQMQKKPCLYGTMVLVCFTPECAVAQEGFLLWPYRKVMAEVTGDATFYGKKTLLLLC